MQFAGMRPSVERRGKTAKFYTRINEGPYKVGTVVNKFVTKYRKPLTKLLIGN